LISRLQFFKIKSMLLETSNDNWDYLIKKTRLQPLVLGWPSLRISRDRITLTSSWGMSFSALCGVAIMIVLFSVWNSLGGLDSAYSVIVAGGVCGFIVLACLSVLTRGNKVYWNPDGSEICIEWGSIFFSRKFTFSRYEVQARLYKQSGETDWKSVIRPEMVVLALQKIGMESSEVKIAIEEYVSTLGDAYGKLAAFLTGESIDKTLVPFLVNENEQNVSNYPISGNRANFATMQLSFPCPERALFSPTLSGRLFWLGFLVEGILSLAILLPLAIHDKVLIGIVLSGGLGCIFTGVGVIGFFIGIGTRRVIADKTQKTVLIDRGIEGHFKGKILLRFDQIAAVQICSGHASAEGGRWGYIGYEINLVLNEPKGKRINLVGQYYKDQLRTEARQFAEFLEKPLLDHTSPSIDAFRC
jgi:hypothetical protein